MGQMGLIMTDKGSRCTRNQEILSEKDGGTKIKTMGTAIYERQIQPDRKVMHTKQKASTGSSLWTLDLFLSSYEDH